MKINKNKSQFFSTREETSGWLDKYNIKNYTVNDDLSVDVKGSVHIERKELKTIPVKFGDVTGNFLCEINNLTSLVGSPKTVGGDFWCSHNKLRSLIGAPRTIAFDFNCSSNNLTILSGSPKNIGGNFYCYNNLLTSINERNRCNFKGNIFFNIDKKNFKQKELIQIFEKYYEQNVESYNLTYDELQNITKPILEKNILKRKLIKNWNKTSIKKIFI